MSVGGPLDSITLNGREFPVAADADVGRKLGGRENEIQMNGNGTGRLIQTPVPSGFTGLVVDCDDTRNDHEYVEDLKNQQEFFPVTVTYISGAVYEGTMQITSELIFNNLASTLAFDLQGAQPLTRQ